MSLSVRRSLTGALAGSAAAFLAMLLGAPTADASCGHYVHIGNPGKDNPAAVMTEGDSRADPDPAPAKPCHGPLCSSQPTAPPSAPAPSAPRVAEVWGHLVVVPRPSRPSAGSGLLPPTAEGPPVRMPALVYRPPR